MRFYYTYSDTTTKEKTFFSFFECYKKLGVSAKIGVNYYTHGPLARTEYGHDKVQGMDYAYTLQGWIKGVNSNTLYAERDMGRDADSTLMFNHNRVFAKDGFGYTLNYYAGDYKAIEYMRWNDIEQRFEATTFGSDLMANTYNLYNGNIKAMVTTIIKPTITPGDTVQFEALPQGTAYKYDQLNRLTEMTAWQNLNTVTNSWNNGLAYTGMYHNKFTYDANGSMLKALAKNMAGQVIDNQTYHHQTDANGDKLRNRTYAITDSATITSGNDLLDQSPFDNTALTINSVNNYSYTEIGERKSNKQDSIDLVVWTVYGKIKEIYRTPGSTKKNIKFDYDASGNRVAKHVFNSDSTWVRTEYYIRDAQGNVMSTYQHNIDSTMHYAQTEKHIYGSSMLGIETKETEMIAAIPVQDGDVVEHALGYKHFTGNNHLGNVLTTFTDRKIPVDLNSNNIIDEYWPDVISSSDYAPFGAYLTERTFNQGTFPNSFNGKREDKELNLQDYGMRPYNPMERELGWKVDPLASKYSFYTPYQFAGNKPIVAIDMDGLEDVWTNISVSNDGYTNKTAIYKEEDNYELTRFTWAQSLGIDVALLPKTGSLTTKVSYNSDGKPISIQYMYTPQIEIVAFKHNPIVRFFKNADRWLNSLKGKTLGEWEGKAAFEGYIIALKTGAEVAEDIAPFGEKTPIIGQIGTGLELTADFMETMADIEEKGIKQGTKNGAIRLAATFIDKLLIDKIDTGLEDGDAASKFGLSKLLGGGKEKLIESSNKSYYESLKSSKSDSLSPEPSKKESTTKADF